MKELMLAAMLMTSGVSVAENRIGVAVLALPMSVRQMGMGDVSTGGNDVLRSWSNPALLADQQTTGEVALNGASMFAGQQTAGGAGIGWRLGSHVVVGGLLGYYTLTAAELDELGNSVGTNLSQDTLSAGLTGAVQVSVFRFGLSVKQVSDSIVNDKTSAGAADIGGAIDLGGISTGVALRNIGQQLRKIEATGITQSLPTEIRGGVSYMYKSMKLSGGVEYAKTSASDGVTGAGLEWWPVAMLGLRGGVTGVGGKDAIQMTVGASVFYKGIGVDYAFGTHPVGPLNRVSLTYAFGSLVQKAPSEPKMVKSLEPTPQPIPVPVVLITKSFPV